MVLLGMTVICSSHRLSIQTTVVSGTVWLQLAMQVLTGGCEPPVWGRGGLRGLEMGPLSSPVVISYRLPIATIGLGRSPFLQCSDLSRTDRQTDGRTDR